MLRRCAEEAFLRRWWLSWFENSESLQTRPIFTRSCWGVDYANPLYRRRFSGRREHGGWFWKGVANRCRVTADVGLGVPTCRLALGHGGAVAHEGQLCLWQTARFDRFVYTFLSRRWYFPCDFAWKPRVLHATALHTNKLLVLFPFLALKIFQFSGFSERSGEHFTGEASVGLVTGAPFTVSSRDA